MEPRMAESAWHETVDNPYLPARHWNSGGAMEKDADLELEEFKSLNQLRLLSSDLCKNNFFAVTAQLAIINLVVGNNISIRVKYPDTDTERLLNNDISEKLKKVDINEEMSYQTLIAMEVSSAYEKGDVLVSLIYDEDRDSKSKLAIELIEAGRIETPIDLEQDPNVRNGVVYNVKGRVTGYWVRKLIPKIHSENIYGLSSENGYTLMPVYKENGGIKKRVLYLYKASLNMRPNQSRMIPMLTPVMGLIRYTGSLFEAVLIGIRVSACFVGAISTDNVAGTKANLTGYSGAQDNKKVSMDTVPFKPNTFMIAPRGSSVSFGTGGRAPDNLTPLLKQIAGFIAMTHRIPYSQYTLDLSDVNYSSFRGGTTEANRMTSRWQEGLTFQTVWFVSELLKEAWLNKDVNFNIAQAKIEVTFPDVSSLDPEKQASADALEMDNFTLTPQQLCSKKGVSYETLIKERQEHLITLSQIEGEVNKVRSSLGLPPLNLTEEMKNDKKR